MRRVILMLCFPLAALAGERETVVLLHGLLATSGTMGHLENTLEAEGYRVVNLDYPSMAQPLEELAPTLREQIAEQTQGAEKVHFVTHSMGGILLRLIQRDDPLPNVGRVVMIAPPNHGSDAVNVLAGLPGALWAMGPAGRQLAAGDNEFLESLGQPDFEFGVIAGDLGIDPWMSSMIPGPDDGVVSVESTKLEGMADFIVIHEAHPLLIFHAQAMDQTKAFLQNGQFNHPADPPEPDSRWTKNWTHRR